MITLNAKDLVSIRAFLKLGISYKQIVEWYVLVEGSSE